MKTMYIYLIVFGLCFILIGFFSLYAIQYKAEEWGLSPESSKAAFVFLGIGLLIVVAGLLVKKYLLHWDALKSFGRSDFLDEEDEAIYRLYAPYMKYTKTEEMFLAEVARFSAQEMDEYGKDEEIERMTVWVKGKIPLEEGSKNRVWKGVKLVWDRSNWRGPAIGDLSNLAYLDRDQFLKLCSLQYIDKSEFPRWPKEAKFYPPV